MVEMLQEMSLEELDEKLEFIPLSFEPIFKEVFIHNKDLLKKFLIDVLDLGIPTELSRINILSLEVPLKKYEAGRGTVNFNILINDNLLVDIEINKGDIDYEVFKTHFYRERSKMRNKIMMENKPLRDLYFYQFDFDDKYEDEDGSHVLVPYDVDSGIIYIENQQFVLKYLKYYHKLYYSDKKIFSASDIWLAGLTATSFVELDEIFSHILDGELRGKLIRDMIVLATNNRYIHEWKRTKFDEFIDIKIAKENEDNHKKDIDKVKLELVNEIIDNMKDNHIDLDIIAKVTGKSVDELR